MISLVLLLLAHAGVTQGTLVAKDGKRIVDVPLEHTEVAIKIEGHVAGVSVSQVFHNIYAHKIEAIYAFPLPAGAAVDRYSLTTGDEVITGQIKKRSEAKQIYARAKALGQIAALLEEEASGAFTQSVANIEPGAKLEVSLHYVQELPYEDDRYELVFPMVITPRPISATAKNVPRFLPPDTRSAHDIGLTVELDPGVAARALESPSHRIEHSGQKIRIAPDDTIPNKDFILRWEAATETPQVSLSAHRRAFMLSIQAPKLADLPVAAPREVVFALDTSSSMAGAPLDKARAIVRRVLGQLGADDTFQILAFSDRVTPLAASPIANTRENVALAGEWIDRLRAGGGTEMGAGLDAALGLEGDPRRLRIVVFVTDGYVGDDQDVLARVAAHLGSTRIFTFGIGGVINRYLLEELAALGRGAFTGLRADEDEARALDRFEERIRRPVLTDISVDWKELQVEQLVPSRIPDLFAGQPLIIHGRYRAPGRATIVVSGLLGAERITLPVEVTLPDNGGDDSSIAPVWAKARIRELMRAWLHGDKKVIEDEITALALENNLVTRFTSFVAVSERLTGGEAARVVPIPLDAPEGLATTIRTVGMGYGGGGSGSFGAGVLGSISVSGHGSGMGMASLMIADSAPMISGALDKDLIHRSLDNHRSAIKHCYELSLLKNPTLRGRLVLRFTVLADGSTTAVKIDESTLGDREVEQCIVARVKTIVFPDAHGGGEVEVNMPYVFENGKEVTP